MLHVAEPLEQLLHLVRARGVGERVFQGTQLVSDEAHRTRPRHRLGDDAAPLHLADVLAEVPDGHAAIDRDLPLVGFFLADDEPEERRLAGAIRADEAGVLAAVHDRAGVEKEDLLAVLSGDAVEPDHFAGPQS